MNFKIKSLQNKRTLIVTTSSKIYLYPFPESHTNKHSYKQMKFPFFITIQRTTKGHKDNFHNSYGSEKKLEKKLTKEVSFNSKKAYNKS